MGIPLLARMLVELARQEKRKPRLHPNGFIQLNLTPDGAEHLHVWPSFSIKTQKTNHPIHSHIFDMESTVLLGGLRNETYSLMPSSDNKVAGRLYQAHYAVLRGPNDTILKPTYAKPCGLYVETIEEIKAGETYRLPSAVLHDSMPRGLTVTHMIKLANNINNPIVMVPVGVEPDNEFVRERVDENMLWGIINYAMAQ